MINVRPVLRRFRWTKEKFEIKSKRTILCVLFIIYNLRISNNERQQFYVEIFNFYISNWKLQLICLSWTSNVIYFIFLIKGYPYISIPIEIPTIKFDYPFHLAGNGRFMALFAAGAVLKFISFGRYLEGFTMAWERFSIPGIDAFLEAPLIRCQLFGVWIFAGTCERLSVAGISLNGCDNDLMGSCGYVFISVLHVFAEDLSSDSLSLELSSVNDFDS